MRLCSDYNEASFVEQTREGWWRINQSCYAGRTVAHNTLKWTQKFKKEGCRKITSWIFFLSFQEIIWLWSVVLISLVTLQTILQSSVRSCCKTQSNPVTSLSSATHWLPIGRLLTVLGGRKWSKRYKLLSPQKPTIKQLPMNANSPKRTQNSS
jgi:hypothetical protein